ncbi:MAG: hypothetical protein AABZ06_10205 [Bdellovibrionota bacterium]
MLTRLMDMGLCTCVQKAWEPLDKPQFVVLFGEKTEPQGSKQKGMDAGVTTDSDVLSGRVAHMNGG